MKHLALERRTLLSKLGTSTYQSSLVRYISSIEVAHTTNIAELMTQGFVSTHSIRIKSPEIAGSAFMLYKATQPDILKHVALLA